MNEKQIQPGTSVAQRQCSSCPFREGGLELGRDRLHEIKEYLFQGTNHFCHSDRSNHTICRGGRDYQLQLWHRMGVIAEPTDEALREAMRTAGVEPEDHV